MRPFLILWAIIGLSLPLLAATDNSIDQQISKINQSFEQGMYNETLVLLDDLQKQAREFGNRKQELLGLIEYWRGLSYLRLNEFDMGIPHLKKAIYFQFQAKDIHYELAQAYYVSDKLPEARESFKKSVKSGHKQAVSLYYMAFISQQIGDLKRAVTYYNAIERIQGDEKNEVLQPARMQIGDIYLKQAEKLSNSYKAVDQLVIPQYERALDWDDESSMAHEIREKIEKLKRKYDLELFKMRNGRPTVRPPYFAKANITYGTDSNVTYSSADTLKATNANMSSSFYSAGFYGRYTFYPNEVISISPEVRFNLTRYNSDEEEVYAYDNYQINYVLRTAYEHVYNNAPATFYVDLEQGNHHDDSDMDKSLEKNYTGTYYTLSEELQFFKGHPTTFRIKSGSIVDVDEGQNYNLTSFMLEQLVMLGSYALYFYNSYDTNRYPDLEAFDSTSMTNRVDLIMPTLFGLFNPGLFVSSTRTSYPNDDERGTPHMKSYGINGNRPLTSNTFIYFDYSVLEQTADLESDNYSKRSFTVTLDYFF